MKSEGLTAGAANFVRSPKRYLLFAMSSSSDAKHSIFHLLEVGSNLRFSREQISFEAVRKLECRLNSKRRVKGSKAVKGFVREVRSWAGIHIIIAGPEWVQ